jgi:transitional endoplasmic reticulum ATPase
MPAQMTLKVAMAQSQSEAGYGRARIDTATRSALGTEVGDTIEILGKRSVVAKVFKCAPEEEGMGLICIDGLTRTDAMVSVDENVVVRKCNPRPAASITLSPNIPQGKVIRFEKGIEKVFRRGLMGRPLVENTNIIIPNVALMGNRSTFCVSATVPEGPVVVTEDTELSIMGSAKKGKGAQTGRQKATYDDVGGLDEEIKRIREAVELPLKHPELFDRLGITAPRGVLLYGPPGTGKTLIAEAVANESGASLFSVRGPEIISQYHGESEEKLRDLFKAAAAKAPSIIFLDEIDSIAPNRDGAGGEAERRVVAQLLTLMDGLGSKENVIVIAATNREEAIDPALRRPGRFDREIEIGIPGRKARKDILTVHMKNMPLAGDVDVDRIAAMTQGFAGADLAALCREAAMKCLGRWKDNMDPSLPIPNSVLEGMKISMADFTSAAADVEPGGMRGVLAEIPKVSWDDIGGLDDVRNKLKEVFLTDANREAFERLGIPPSRGILLYGPPGTGKTLVAKAMANESGTNFISVSGPELIVKWVGESEKAIRQTFRRAKQMAPCIIFFDEMDAIAPVRGNSADSRFSERMVAQLLTSMDGIENVGDVFVMGATNRPDMIDPALLRPGRFDSMVLIGKPDTASRLSILKVHSSKMPLKGVDLEDIARRTDGYVGADLAALCREAALCAYRRDHDAPCVESKDFEKALQEVRPSVKPEVLDSYKNIESKLKERKDGWEGPGFYS